MKVMPEKKHIIKLFFILTYVMGICHSVSAQSLLINEVMHSNIDGIMDDLNEFPDSWIEIYNADTVDINIENYSIGRTANFVDSWPLLYDITIPAKGYFLIYCDKNEQLNHTDFRIDVDDTSELFLFDPDGNIIETVELPAMITPNISYGRIHDGCDTFSFFKKATPLSKNEGFYTERVLKKPDFSIKGGIYTAPIELQLSLQGDYPSDATIHYTTDGSEPTEESPIAPTSLFIDKTTIIRAKTFSDSALSKPSKTESYIFMGRETKLPIISVAIDSLYLWDDMIGIYTEGNYYYVMNGTEKDTSDGIGYDPNSNFLHKWRRPCNIEYFSDNSPILNQLTEINITGNGSRFLDLKSLVFHANKRFGKKVFSHHFWQNKEIDEIKQLYLRNSGQDYMSTFLRDATISTIAGEHIDIDWSAYRPIILFINGEYYGLMNLRERSNEQYVWQNYHKLENIDMISQTHGYKNEILAGDLVEWENLENLFESDTTTYKSFYDKIDMDEFITHLVIESIFCNTDFPGNNLVSWRERKKDSKWRWILKDLDYGLGLSVYDYNYNYLNFILRVEPFKDEGISSNPQIACDRYRKLMSFNEFRNEYIDKSTIYLSSFLSDSTVANLIDSLANDIDDEIFNMDLNGMRNHQGWSDCVWWMKWWYSNRVPFFYHHLQDFFSLGDTTSLVIESHKSKQLYFNDVKVENNRFNGKYYEKRHLFLSHDSSSFSYNADTFNAFIDTIPTSSYWIVRYQLNDSIIQNIFHTNNLLYHIPLDAQNVYITDTLFVSGDSLSTITKAINKPFCSFSANELSLSSPWVHDQLGNIYKGFLIDTLLSLGTNIIDWNVVTLSGDTLHYPQTVVLIDSCAPEIDCQQLTTIELSITTNKCILDNTEVSLPIPTATDNCDSIVGTLSAPEEYNLGNNTIYWTFTDSAGNTTQCSQNIMVVDRFAPYYDCQKLPDLSFDLNTINCSIDSSEIQLTSPIATDNCGTAIVGTLSAPNEYLVGNNMIYWTFTDSAGNTSQCPQNIIVLDKVAPVVNCDYIVPLTYNIFTSDCGINSQLLNIQTPYAIDNCESIVVGHADIPDYFEIGDHTIDWHFTDIYGNESSCSQSVTIADYYAPVVQPDAETILYITLPLNANDISSDEIDLPTLFATDNCDERIEGDVTLPTNFSIGDNILLWTFSDDYGNISYFPQNVYAIKQFELMIYPNPVDETLYISGVEPDEEIILYNMFGQRIYQTKSIGNPATIDMSQFTDNLYFILFRNQYYKIIKK